MQPRKDKYESDLREVAESLSKQPEWKERGFWKDYLYWSLRCVPVFVVLTFAANYNTREGLLGSVDHLSMTQWLIGIAVAFFLGPALVIALTTAYWKLHEFGDRYRAPKDGR